MEIVREKTRCGVGVFLMLKCLMLVSSATFSSRSKVRVTVGRKKVLFMKLVRQFVNWIYLNV